MLHVTSVLTFFHPHQRGANESHLPVLICALVDCEAQ